MNNTISMMMSILGISIAFSQDPGSTGDPDGIERNLLVSAQKLSESKNPVDRVEAAKKIIAADSSLTPISLIEKLISDKDDQVKISSYRALGVVSKKSSFTLGDAKKISESLELQITKENIDSIFEGELSQEKAILLIEQICALDSLLRFHPLISPFQFQNWQTEKYGYLARRLTGLRYKFNDDLDERYLMLMFGIMDPAVLNELIPSIADELNNISSFRVAGMLLILWSNPLCGKSGPMNENLKKAIKPKLDALKSKITNEKNTSEFRKAVLILNDIAEK